MAARADYSEALLESSLDHQWKTARHVDPRDFNKLTRRLRYQASTLLLDIEIRTDKQLNTVSFLTSKQKVSGKPSK